MKQFRITVSIFLFCSVIISCQKGLVNEESNPPADTTTISTVPNCKLSRLMDISTSTSLLIDLEYYEYDASGKGTRFIEKDSLNGVEFDWKISVTDKKLSFRNNQWIDLDDSGRISKSYINHWMNDSVSPGTRLVATYQYNNNGYLSRYSYIQMSNPASIYDDITNTWKDGNMVKAYSLNETGSYSILELTYDTSLVARNFFDFSLSPEITNFQRFIKFGKPSKNLPTRFHQRNFMPDGSLDDESVMIFSGYKFDEKGNVKSFHYSRKDTGYPTVNSEVILSYRCF